MKQNAPVLEDVYSTRSSCLWRAPADPDPRISIPAAPYVRVRIPVGSALPTIDSAATTV